MQLVFLPFAGGSSFSYNVLRPHLTGLDSLLMLEAPGRGRRLREPLLYNFDALVQDMVAQLEDRLEANYTLYGHSMGTILVREVVHELRRRGLPLPIHLVCTGSEAPSFSPKGRKYHELPVDDLKQVLRDFGGIEPEILEHAELMNMLLPVFRADFAAVETYKYVERPPLNIPLTVLIGAQENILQQEAEAWSRESTLMRPLITLPGGHFFIFEQASEFVRHLLHFAQTPRPSQ